MEAFVSDVAPTLEKIWCQTQVPKVFKGLRFSVHPSLQGDIQLFFSLTPKTSVMFSKTHPLQEFHTAPSSSCHDSKHLMPPLMKNIPAGVGSLNHSLRLPSPNLDRHGRTFNADGKIIGTAVFPTPYCPVSLSSHCASHFPTCIHSIEWFPSSILLTSIHLAVRTPTGMLTRGQKVCSKTKDPSHRGCGFAQMETDCILNILDLFLLLFK